MQEQTGLETKPQITQLLTKIVAWYKYPAGKPVMKALRESDALILIREPTNSFDKNAITVWGLDLAKNKVQLGYIPGPVAAILKDKKLCHCIKHGSAPDAIVVGYTDA